MLFSYGNNMLITLRGFIAKRTHKTPTVYPQETNLDMSKGYKTEITGGLRYKLLYPSLIVLGCPGPALSPDLKPPLGRTQRISEPGNQRSAWGRDV